MEVRLAGELGPSGAYIGSRAVYIRGSEVISNYLPDGSEMDSSASYLA
jgi:hypothetical protein